MCEVEIYLPLDEKSIQVFLDLEQATHNRVPVDNVAKSGD